MLVGSVCAFARGYLGRLLVLGLLGVVLAGLTCRANDAPNFAPVAPLATAQTWSEPGVLGEDFPNDTGLNFSPGPALALPVRVPDSTRSGESVAGLTFAVLLLTVLNLGLWRHIRREYGETPWNSAS